MKTRKEYDSIGSVNVPVDKYWGASTQRSSKYFNIGDFLVRPIVIKSIAMIKKAAAIVNTKNGDLDKKISGAIVRAANEVISGKIHSKISNYELEIKFLEAQAKEKFFLKNSIWVNRNDMKKIPISTLMKNILSYLNLS